MHWALSVTKKAFTYNIIYPKEDYNDIYVYIIFVLYFMLWLHFLWIYKSFAYPFLCGRKLTRQIFQFWVKRSICMVPEWNRVVIWLCESVCYSLSTWQESVIGSGGLGVSTRMFTLAQPVICNPTKLPKRRMTHNT